MSTKEPGVWSKWKNAENRPKSVQPMSRPSSQWPRQSYAPSLGFSTMIALLFLFTSSPVKVLESWFFGNLMFLFFKVWLLWRSVFWRFGVLLSLRFGLFGRTISAAWSLHSNPCPSNQTVRGISFSRPSRKESRFPKVESNTKKKWNQFDYFWLKLERKKFRGFFLIIYFLTFSNKLRFHRKIKQKDNW